MVGAVLRLSFVLFYVCCHEDLFLAACAFLFLWYFEIYLDYRVATLYFMLEVLSCNLF